MIQSMIQQGKIVPSEVTVRLLLKAMEESSSDKFLIDGFPRNEENRMVFENLVCYPLPLQDFTTGAQTLQHLLLQRTSSTTTKYSPPDFVFWQNEVGCTYIELLIIGANLKNKILKVCPFHSEPFFLLKMSNEAKELVLLPENWSHFGCYLSNQGGDQVFESSKF